MKFSILLMLLCALTAARSIMATSRRCPAIPSRLIPRHHSGAGSPCLIFSASSMSPALLNPSCWKRKSVPAKLRRVAAAGLILAALAITAILILLPLKTTDIELWSVDKQTGRYEYMTRLKERDIASEKALVHSLAAHYVRLREGYNYFSLQRDYDDVQLFNSDSVNRDYLDGFNGDRPRTLF